MNEHNSTFNYAFGSSIKTSCWTGDLTCMSPQTFRLRKFISRASLATNMIRLGLNYFTVKIITKCLQTQMQS